MTVFEKFAVREIVQRNAESCDKFLKVGDFGKCKRLFDIRRTILSNIYAGACSEWFIYDTASDYCYRKVRGRDKASSRYEKMYLYCRSKAYECLEDKG